MCETAHRLGWEQCAIRQHPLQNKPEHSSHPTSLNLKPQTPIPSHLHQQNTRFPRDFPTFGDEENAFSTSPPAPKREFSGEDIRAAIAAICPRPTSPG